MCVFFFQIVLANFILLNGNNKHEPPDIHSTSDRILCDAVSPFYNTVAITASFPLEEPQRTEGHSGHHTYGPFICHRLLCWSVGYSGQWSLFHILGVCQGMLWGLSKSMALNSLLAVNQICMLLSLDSLQHFPFSVYRWLPSSWPWCIVTWISLSVRT